MTPAEDEALIRKFVRRFREHDDLTSDDAYAVARLLEAMLGALDISRPESTDAPCFACSERALAAGAAVLRENR